MVAALVPAKAAQGGSTGFGPAATGRVVQVRPVRIEGRLQRVPVEAPRDQIRGAAAEKGG